jgi:hypothetical protein
MRLRLLLFALLAATVAFAIRTLAADAEVKGTLAADGEPALVFVSAHKGTALANQEVKAP